MFIATYRQCCLNQPWLNFSGRDHILPTNAIQTSFRK